MSSTPFVRVRRAARVLREVGLEEVATSVLHRWDDLTPSHTRMAKNADKLDRLANTAEALAETAREHADKLRAA